MAVYEFHIYFFGLICHVGGTNKKHFAAIVRDIDHRPVVIREPGEERDEHAIDGNTVGVKFEIDDVLGASDATTTASFRTFVPSLEKLMGGSPRPNIERYAIPVYYPDGDVSPLTVNSFYTPLGWYIRSGTTVLGPHCVGQLTGLTVTVIGEPAAPPTLRVIRIDAAGNNYPVGDPFKAGSCLVIANQPKHRGHAHGHVRKFSKILIDDDSLITVAQPGFCYEKAETKPACGWLRDWLVRSANDVECGNTQWP